MDVGKLEKEIIMTSTCLLIGGSGGLGTKLIPYLRDTFTNVIYPTHEELKIENKANVESYLKCLGINDSLTVINMACVNIDSAAHKLNEADVTKQIDANIIGNINLVSCVLPYIRNTGGNIIIFSSVLASKGVFGTSVYSGCKGFVESFTRTVALENVNKDVNIAAIQLGYFEGGLTERIHPDIKDVLIDAIPAKRLGKIEEIHNTIKYICHTPYVSGTTIKVNGGLL
jgi:NAD(P)-dependent dehydrogenase (short-subunit alcohol dehydrogenase family)